MAIKYVRIEVVEFVADTDKANLCKLANGKKIWIPIAACDVVHIDVGEPPLRRRTGWVTVAEWFVKKNYLGV
jgi:hypothetical protein